jgi:hypothetical protein
VGQRPKAKLMIYQDAVKIADEFLKVKIAQ